MKKRVASIFLALSLMLTMCIPVSAKNYSSDELSGDYESVIEYYDSQGKKCYVELTYDATDNTIVTADSKAKWTFDLNTEEVIREDLNTGEVLCKTVELPTSNMAPETRPAATNTYVYAGRVYYNPYIAPSGDSYDCSLEIYGAEIGSGDDEFTVNGDAYDTVSGVIGLITAALAGVGLSLDIAEIVGSSILGYLIEEGIGAITDDVIKEAFTETFYTDATYYSLKAVDPDLDTFRVYDDGVMHHVRSQKAGYNEYYYEGYYPQFLQEEDTAVAYWLYTDFWGFDYPGVDRFFATSNF